MARTINLLPPELSPKKAYTLIGRKIKTISIIGYIILIVMISASAAAFFILSGRLNSLADKQKQLGVDLNNLKNSEAKIVILKDRAQKSKEVFDTNLTRASVDSFDKIKSEAPEGIEFSELTIEGDEILITATSQNSQNIESFIGLILASDNFKKIILSEMAFDRGSGYSISLAIGI